MSTQGIFGLIRQEPTDLGPVTGRTVDPPASPTANSCNKLLRPPGDTADLVLHLSRYALNIADEAPRLKYKVPPYVQPAHQALAKSSNKNGAMPLIKPTPPRLTLTTSSKSPLVKRYIDYRIFLKSIRTMTEPLPDLPAVERLSPRVVRILGGNPSKFTLQGTNTYLVGQGPKRILIDTGEGKAVWRESLQRVLREERVEVESVLLTHWHHDHVGGVPDLLALSPGARIHKNQSQARADMGEIAHDQVFRTEGATLRACHSPGHTVDHVALVLEEEDAMFTGDNVLGHGTAVFEDLAAYMASLGAMKERFGGRAYPAHGALIDDGPAKIREYIAHRQEREDQVLAVLKSERPEGEGGAEAEGWESMAMVRNIYREYPESLHGPAEGSLLQVLRKMEMDGRVRRCGDGSWKLTEKALL